MNRKALLIILIVIIIIGLGALGYLFLIPKCPKSCDDGNDCTRGVCSKETDYKCKAISIPDCCGNKTCELEENYGNCPLDCPNCEDNNNCTKDYFDYYNQKCSNSPILEVVCCGNTICEVGETYQTCARDCPNCDDNNQCTNDSYDYHQRECLNEVKIPCCGNKICDKGAETNSNCSVDCPSCNDDSRLTADTFNYATQKCENTVTHYFIDDFESGIQNWSLGGEGGTWSTAKEGSNTVLRGVNHNWAELIGKNWSDYIFKAKFKIIKGGIHFNYRLTQKEKGPNRYFIFVDSQTLSLSKQLEESFQILTDPPVSLKLAAGWHTFEIRGYGSTLNVLVDGTLLIKYNDANNSVLSGTIGLETHDNSEFLIDDVEVKVISSTDVVNP